MTWPKDCWSRAVSQGQWPAISPEAALLQDSSEELSLWGRPICPGHDHAGKSRRVQEMRSVVRAVAPEDIREVQVVTWLVCVSRVWPCRQREVTSWAGDQLGDTVGVGRLLPFICGSCERKELKVWAPGLERPGTREVGGLSGPGDVWTPPSPPSALGMQVRFLWPCSSVPNSGPAENQIAPEAGRATGRLQHLHLCQGCTAGIHHPAEGTQGREETSRKRPGHGGREQWSWSTAGPHSCPPLSSLAEDAIPAPGSLLPRGE